MPRLLHFPRRHSKGVTVRPQPASDMEHEAQTDLTIRLSDGRTLGYAEYGDPGGVALLGLHGTPGSRFMFQVAHPVACELGVRLLAPERPGFGISTYRRDRTLANYAQDIAEFADAAGLTQFGVVGVSGGGPYAAACAALLPERVTALGLISPVGPLAGTEGAASIGLGHHIAFRILPRLPPLTAALFSTGRIGFLHTPNVMVNFIRSRAAPSDWAILARQEVRRNLIRGVAEGCRPGIRSALQEMRIFSRPWNIPFDAIKAPAFLWQGLSDRNVSVAAALRLAELVPDCRTTWIEKAGHYWIFDNIRQVLQIIANAARSAR
jgi:pimeloyl-ACP methyl ester carboxylesterase